MVEWKLELNDHITLELFVPFILEENVIEVHDKEFVYNENFTKIYQYVIIFSQFTPFLPKLAYLAYFNK